MRQFIDQTQVTFPVGWDDSGSYFNYRQPGGISPFPLEVVVDRDGSIAYLSNQFNSAELQAVVDGLMGGP